MSSRQSGGHHDELNLPGRCPPPFSSAKRSDAVNEAKATEALFLRGSSPPADEPSAQIRRRLFCLSPSSSSDEDDKPAVGRGQRARTPCVDSSSSDEDDEPVMIRRRAEGRERRPQLFLVPTGTGKNDHSLDDFEGLVDDLGPVWGFVSGKEELASRMKPGDILLMTTSGTKLFNRVASVREVKKDEDGKLGGKIWGPEGLNYSMGNRPKVANKPFTVIVKLGVIRSANINKDDMMADLGYDDHLQTSRLIVAGVRKDRKLTGEKLASIIDFLSARLSEEETSEETEERLMRLEKTLKAHLQRASSHEDQQNRAEWSKSLQARIRRLQAQLRKRREDTNGCGDESGGSQGLPTTSEENADAEEDENGEEDDENAAATEDDAENSEEGDGEEDAEEEGEAVHRGFVSGPEGSDSRGEQEEGQASAIALCCRKKGRVLGDVAPRDTTWRREAKEMEEESRGEAGGMRRDRRRSEREEADEREKRGDQEGGETTEEGAPPQDEGGTGGGLAPRGLVGTQEDEAETPESDGAGPSWEPIVHAGSLGPVSPSPVLHVVRADGKDPSSPHRKAAQGDPRTPSMAAPPKAQPAESPADWKGAGGAITARGIAFGDEDEQKERAPVEVVQFLPAIVTRGSKRPRFRHQVAGLVAMRGYGRNSPRGGSERQWLVRWAAEGAEDSWAEEAELLDDCPSLVAEALGGEVYRLQEESKRLQEETARLSSRLKRRREEEEAAAAEVEVLRGAAAEAKEEAERLREELLTERRRRADLVVLSKNLFLGLAKP